MKSHLNRKEISSNDLHKLDRMARKVLFKILKLNLFVIYGHVIDVS